MSFHGRFHCVTEPLPIIITDKKRLRLSSKYLVHG